MEYQTCFWGENLVLYTTFRDFDLLVSQHEYSNLQNNYFRFALCNWQFVFDDLDSYGPLTSKVHFDTLRYSEKS
jgi:hypothetical protein